MVKIETKPLSQDRPTAYRALCAASERGAGTIKLGRGPDGWILQVVLRPTDDDPAWRAAAAAFPAIGEIDANASPLLQWLDFWRPVPRATEFTSSRADAPGATRRSTAPSSARSRQAKPPGVNSSETKERGDHER